MKTAAEEEVDAAVNMTTDKRVEFQVRLSDAKTEATTWSIADMDPIVSQLEREIYSITSNEQMRLKKELSICLIEFEAWWQGIGVQELWKTIELRVIHFGYPKMHPVSHVSESIWRMGSGDIFTTDDSEWLHIDNMKEAYRSTNKVNYLRQMLKHNDRSTDLDYMEQTLPYLTLQGWYDIDSAKVFTRLSAANKRRNTRRALLLRLQHGQDKSFYHHVSPQVQHLGETHVHGVCRSIKLFSLRDASEDVGVPKCGQLFRAKIEEDWGH